MRSGWCLAICYFLNKLFAKYYNFFENFIWLCSLINFFFNKSYVKLTVFLKVNKKACLAILNLNKYSYEYQIYLFSCALSQYNVDIKFTQSYGEVQTSQYSGPEQNRCNSREDICCLNPLLQNPTSVLGASSQNGQRHGIQCPQHLYHVEFPLIGKGKVWLWKWGQKLERIFRFGQKIRIYGFTQTWTICLRWVGFWRITCQIVVNQGFGD